MSETPAPSLRDSYPIVAFSALCAFLSAPGQTFFISAFIPSFAAGFSIGAGDLGALYMAATLGAAALAPLTGSWIDRTDLRLFVVLTLTALAIACLVTASASTALVFHIQTIASLKDWPGSLVGPAFSGFAAGHVAGLAASGDLVDRLGAKSMMPVMNAPLLLGLIVLAATPSSIGLFVFLTLAGASAGLVQTTVGAMWAEVYGVERLGAIAAAGAFSSALAGVDARDRTPS